MDESLSLGEYVRRLRRERRWSLYDAARECKLSYTHLSRIENDSTVPGPDTVARLAVALGGDLRTMLEKAKCLPAVILEHMSASGAATAPAVLKRAAFPSERGPGRPGPDRTVRQLAGDAVLNDRELDELATAVAQLAQLPDHQRSMVSKFILSLGMEPPGEPVE
jgi:transcriptional regulator with XRE-family HTH domain